jgi:hypothetical protein
MPRVEGRPGEKRFSFGDQLSQNGLMLRVETETPSHEQDPRAMGPKLQLFATLAKNDSVDL